MNQFLLILVLSLISVNCYFGLEEVDVTLVSDKKISFNGVITIVPHTENVVIWLCNKNKLNLLHLINGSEIVKKLYFLNDYKGFIVRCGYKMKIDKNELGLHQITLLANDSN
ncbi:unnamed protein product [Paramecium sonneborni]|uniref:Uncharacterized protein n=1 Tax=Paramecium sonneborni TaxID=65129 RepID=A0A8S1R673_9CILI|nr:unnamed protein product [Paramecium sonneborni]